MKIWIINHYAIPPSYGGLVRHFYFSKFLQEKGHEVKIITSSKIHNLDKNMITDRSLYLEKVVDGVEYTFVRNSNYKGNGFDRIINMAQFTMRIWKVCKRFDKPDIIYTSSPDIFTAISATLLAKKMKVKKVVEIRDLWPESIVEYSGKSKNNPVIRILYQLEKWLYKNADKLIFTMEGGRAYIEEKNWNKKIDIEKVYNVNNGVDLKEFEYNKENFCIGDEDLNNENYFKVVYAGSIRKVNNLGKLLECAKCLKKQNSNIRFLIWGEGTEKMELEQRCTVLGLNNIVFKGRVEKKYIPYILSKADVNLMHWRYTSLARFGVSANKLFDYLAAGKPILSDINSEYNLISNYNCGIVTKDDSVESILSGLYELEGKTKEELAEYGNNAKELAKQYDYLELTKKIEDILQETISK